MRKPTLRQEPPINRISVQSVGYKIDKEQA